MYKILLFLVASILILNSCKKTEGFVSARMINDCTGWYLQIDKKDYLVCNFAMVSKYKSGKEFYVQYYKTDECDQVDGMTIRCMMVRPIESYIIVLNTKYMQFYQINIIKNQ